MAHIPPCSRRPSPFQPQSSCMRRSKGDFVGICTQSPGGQARGQAAAVLLPDRQDRGDDGGPLRPRQTVQAASAAVASLAQQAGPDHPRYPPQDRGTAGAGRHIRPSAWPGHADSLETAALAGLEALFLHAPEVERIGKVQGGWRGYRGYRLSARSEPARTSGWPRRCDQHVRSQCLGRSSRQCHCRTRTPRRGRWDCRDPISVCCQGSRSPRRSDGAAASERRHRDHR